MSLQIVNGTLSVVDGYALIEPTHQSVIFGFGGLIGQTSLISTTNTFSYPGIMSNDIAGVGTPRSSPAAASYGGDKAIFGFGEPSSFACSLTNLVSNTGVMATDTAGVADSTRRLAAAGYGGDKAIFGFGVSTLYSVTNHTYLVSNAGVMASSYSAVGTGRHSLVAAGYGGDKAIFAYGDINLTFPATSAGICNLVSNTGVVAADSSTSLGVAIGLVGVAATYGTDKAIFAWGYNQATQFGSVDDSIIYTLLSNTGVFVSSGTTLAAGRNFAGGAAYDGDKAVFGFGGGNNGLGVFYLTNSYNLISNTGIVAADQSALNASARTGVAAAAYGG